MELRNEKRRILALSKLIARKRRGLDLTKLTIEQRIWYDTWHDHKANSIDSSENLADAYANLIEPNYIDDFPLRSDISRILFGTIKEIIITDTELDAAIKYKMMMEN